jgi:peptidoglycan/LPS O-acetylase OafA/YrhL
MRRIAHVPGLDGLRGLAVCGVLLFHANGLLRGGYLGVDLFFVLSGFLITSILVREHEKSGTIDLKAFWVRRARRLLPALLSLIPAIALYARTLAAKDELPGLRADALATIGYVANWRAILARRSYWEMFTAPSPLEHTWSLAIEEQFYVVWPLLVFALLVVAKKNVRALLLTSVVLGLASCAAMAVLYATGGDTTRVYLGTDTRGAAILVGAALATSGLVRGKPSRVVDGIAIAGAIVLAIAWLRLDGQDDRLYRGGFWITELAGAALLLACVRNPEGIVARVFSLKPLRLMGLVSYGVYLWHWPIYVVLTPERVHLGAIPLLVVRIALTLAIAAASYRWFERPIREKGLSGIGLTRPIVIVPSAFAVAVALVVFSTRGGVVKAAAAEPVFVPAPPPPPVEKAGVVTTFPAAPPGTIPPAAELPPGTLRVLVLGDSVGLAMGARMHWVQEPSHAFVAHRAIGDCSILDGIVPVHSMGGTPHGNGNCARNWVDDTKELEPDVALIVIGGAFWSTVKVGWRWRTVCDREWHDAYAKRLAELLTAIAPHAKRRVVLQSAYPVGKWQTPTLDDKVDCYNRILTDAATEAGAETIDLNAFACPDKTCTMESQGQPVRPDGLHFDGLGADDTCRWILARLHGE